MMTMEERKKTQGNSEALEERKEARLNPEEAVELGPRKRRTKQA